MKILDAGRWIAEHQRCVSYVSAAWRPLAPTTAPTYNSKKRTRAAIADGERVA
jgi:hypothetical protein